jgi:hypothetical protein
MSNYKFSIRVLLGTYIQVVRIFRILSDYVTRAYSHLLACFIFCSNYNLN